MKIKKLIVKYTMLAIAFIAILYPIYHLIVTGFVNPVENENFIVAIGYFELIILGFFTIMQLSYLANNAIVWLKDKVIELYKWADSE